MQGFDDAMGQKPAGQQPEDPLAGADFTEEQRATINKFVLMGTEMLVDEGFMQKAAQMLEKFPSTEEAMAQIATAIASRIYMQSVKEENPIPLELVVTGGALLMQKVGEFAQAAGKELTEESVEDAFYRAADLFRELLKSKGLITDQDLQEGYEVLRQQHGDDTFEVINSRVQGVQQAGMPQAPQQQMGAAK